MASKKVFEEFKLTDDKSVWNYFHRERGGLCAQCNFCKKELKTSHGSTSGLIYHLKSIHKLNILKRRNVEASEIECPSTRSAHKPTSSNLLQFFKLTQDDSLSAVLAWMCALDGLPFLTICTSDDIRKGLLARGFNQIPSSANTIRKMITEYAKKIRISTAKEINKQQVH